MRDMLPDAFTSMSKKEPKSQLWIVGNNMLLLIIPFLPPPPYNSQMNRKSSLQPKRIQNVQLRN